MAPTEMISLERLTQSEFARSGIDSEMLGTIGMIAAMVWSVMARSQYADEKTARAETKRFAQELNRLILAGVLEPGTRLPSYRPPKDA